MFVDNVCALIELVLQNNYFKFNDISYSQKTGTALGSSMAPAYASLFMGKFEMDFMKICSEKKKNTLVKVFRRHFYGLDTQSR